MIFVGDVDDRARHNRRTRACVVGTQMFGDKVIRRNRIVIAKDNNASARVRNSSVASFGAVWIGHEDTAHSVARMLGDNLLGLVLRSVVDHDDFKLFGL